jgi:nicotinamidase-related amidase
LAKKQRMPILSSLYVINTLTSRHEIVIRMKAALLVVDIQNEFFSISQVCTDSLKSAIQYVNAAIALFRERNLPVIAIQHKSAEDDLLPGKVSFDIPDTVRLEPSDLRIVKTHGNSFNNTGLTEKLHDLGVDTVVITGFCAEQCVLSTYKGAEDLDFKPIILKNSIASDNLEHLKSVEEITDTITLGALRALL